MAGLGENCSQRYMTDLKVTEDQGFLVHLSVQKVQTTNPISPQSGRSLSCKHKEKDATIFQILCDCRYQVVTAEDGNPLSSKKWMQRGR